MQALLLPHMGESLASLLNFTDDNFDFDKAMADPTFNAVFNKATGGVSVSDINNNGKKR